MKILRRIARWFNDHSWLSLFLIVAFIVAFVVLKRLVERSRGQLTDPIKRGAIIDSVYGIGTVQSNKIYQLKLGVVATIKELFVKEGDTLKKGDRLANVDGVIYKAPFDGTVTALAYNVGENVFAQTPLMTIVNLADRYVTVSMEQLGALRVRRGQKVVLSFDSMRDQRFSGEVGAVYSNDRNFLARIDVKDLPNNILPGMTADVAISIIEKTDVLLIPIAALEADGVWVHTSSFARHASVKTGIVDKEWAEVVSGDVQPGDQLVIRKKISP